MTIDQARIEAVARAIYAAQPVTINIENDVVAWERLDHEFYAGVKEESIRLARAAIEADPAIGEMREALRLLRSHVREGAVSRYMVIPGAALNSAIEAVDQILAKHGS